MAPAVVLARTVVTGYLQFQLQEDLFFEEIYSSSSILSCKTMRGDWNCAAGPG